MSSPDLPASLRDAYTSGALVPFVGAGVSMAVRRKTGEPAFPSWQGLLLRAADRMDAEMRDGGSVVRAMLEMQQPRYMDAAKYARDGLGNLWADFLRDAFNIRRNDIDPSSLGLARQVWALESQLVITTNYDRVLRWTCPDRDDLVEIDIEAPTQLLAATRGKLERSTIWHLHGSLSEPANIILSPDGYNKLYATERQERAYGAALTTLRSMVASRTLLFVGFSLDDPYIVRQLEWVRYEFRGFAGPHYIMVRNRDVSPMLRAKFTEVGVDIVTFEDFGAPMQQRLAQLRGTTGAVPAPVSTPVSSTPPSPLPDAPLKPDPVKPSTARPHSTQDPSVHSSKSKRQIFKIALGSVPLGMLFAGLAIWASEESHQTCEAFPTRGYFLQLATYQSAEHAVSQATKLAQGASMHNIPGDSVLLVRPPHVVVGLTGFADRSSAELHIENAKSILGQGGYNRAWEDFCDETWSSEDRSTKASIADRGFDALRSRRHCFCYKPDDDR